MFTTFKPLAIFIAIFLLLGCNQEANENADYAASTIYSYVIQVKDTQLPGITDVATAKAAAVEIEKKVTQIQETMSTMELDENGKAVVRETIADADAEIVEKLEEACKIPGVEEVISPAVTNFLSALKEI